MRLLLILLPILLACESGIPAAAAPTPEPTPDIRPIKTAIAQRTPIAPTINAPSPPTPTLIPPDTPTPAPTATPVPTPTPEPRGIDGLTKSKREAILAFNPATPTVPLFNSPKPEGLGRTVSYIMPTFRALGFDTSNDSTVESGIRRTIAVQENMSIVLEGPVDSEYIDKACIYFYYHEIYPILEIETLVSSIDYNINTSWAESLIKVEDNGDRILEELAIEGDWVIIVSKILEEGLGVVYIIPLYEE